MKIDLLQASLLPRRENLREKSEKIVLYFFNDQNAWITGIYTSYLEVQSNPLNNFELI